MRSCPLSPRRGPPAWRERDAGGVGPPRRAPALKRHEFAPPGGMWPSALHRQQTRPAVKVLHYATPAAVGDQAGVESAPLWVRAAYRLTARRDPASFDGVCLAVAGPGIGWSAARTRSGRRPYCARHCSGTAMAACRRAVSWSPGTPYLDGGCQRPCGSALADTPSGLERTERRCHQ